ncbi:helix-turn-helix domain-containing protein [Enterocloster lavalensis]|uniref:helix-turn-helix domain-containing protein n=1 Tax=Enterocloster lavalensis TaxID=460384 RepID=UPI0023F01091|nr:helix-turn-helix domain-containing protein [Enterocloster lavalensis]
MDDLNLGKKLQMYRTSRSMSIRELSDATGITASMLSQIEHEQVNPSINSLNNIAKALGVPLYCFFQEEIIKEPVVRHDSRKTIGRPENAEEVYYELLTPDTNGTIEFCMMVIPSHSNSFDSVHCHTGEEVAYFLGDGDHIGITIEGRTLHLKRDDSVRIAPFSNHVWHNDTDQTARVIFAITPPSF